MLQRKERDQGNGLHVLVVDDDVHTLESVRATLTDAGYQVTSTDIAANLAARIAMLAPDLVLLDVLMPGLSGVDLSLLLKSHAGTDGPGIVLLSPIPPAVLNSLVDTNGALGVIHVDKKTSISALLEGVRELLATRTAPVVTNRPAPNVSGTHRIGDVRVQQDSQEHSRTGGTRRR